MIGFFDSGSGGLSVLSHFVSVAPLSDVVYFGDIKNAPYGEKTAEELARLTVSGVEVLKRHGATSVVSACNSVSTSILAGAAGDLPFVEMTIPTAEYLKQFSGKRFLLLATPATVASGIYTRALEGIVLLDSLGIPSLAGAIEFGEPEEQIRSIATQALEEKRDEAYDGVILGCTHYPLARSVLAPLIEEYCKTALIIDPGLPVAEAAAARFGYSGQGTLRFLISKDSTAFRSRVEALFPGGEYTIEVV